MRRKALKEKKTIRIGLQDCGDWLGKSLKHRMDYQEWQAGTLFHGLKLKDRFLQKGDFSSVLLFKIIFCFFYLLMATLGLHCFAWAFSSCRKRGPFFTVVHGPALGVRAGHQ